MKLLLHVCCAPCLIYPLARLRQCGGLVTGFFYNPNIAPCEEYRLRKESLESYRSHVGMDVIYRDPEQRGNNGEQSGDESQKRCRDCWRERLMETAGYARDNGFDSFSTTLLVSPYQDHGALRDIGAEASARTGCAFYYEDFRVGFREARARARSLGLYGQKYCGCLASLQERLALKKT
jgi:epoxyqueuosine reductase